MSGFRAAVRHAIACWSYLALVQPSYADPPVIANPPRSIGPNKNVVEWLAQPPTATFKVEDMAGMERCLTIALSFGLGGAPVVIHDASATTMYSLLPKTFGLVSTMLILRSDGYLEYRGKQEFELGLIKQCIKPM